MSYFEFDAEELRRLILNKDVIISKCPDCGCYSQFGHPGHIPGDSDGNTIPINLVKQYMDEHCNEENNIECWWDECETCEGLGYKIRFIDEEVIK